MQIKQENESVHGSFEINDFGIYDNIPELSTDGVNASIEPNSLFKYECCYYRVESNGELVFVSTGDASGRLVIPPTITINGKSCPVTRIGDMKRYNWVDTYYPNGDRRKKQIVEHGWFQFGAFFGSKVTECVFPSTLREFTGNIVYGSFPAERHFGVKSLLEDYGLPRCDLKSVSFAGDETGNLESIPSEAFKYCQLEMACLRIPEGVRYIGDYAFYGKFSRVKLPSTLETIGDNAFWYCNIKNINLPDSLEIVGKNFVDITYCAEKLEFPSKIKRIPQLEWNTTDRWNFVSKSLPELVVYNGKKDVVVDELTSKNCIIEYINKAGRREVDRKRIRNYCFKEKAPKDFKDLNGYHVSLMGILCFMLFWLLMLVVLGILVATGVLE